MSVKVVMEGGTLDWIGDGLLQLTDVGALVGVVGGNRSALVGSSDTGGRASVGALRSASSVGLLLLGRLALRGRHRRVLGDRRRHLGTVRLTQGKKEVRQGVGEKQSAVWANCEGEDVIV